MVEWWRKKASPEVVVQAALVNEDNVIDVGFWCGADRIEEIDPEHPDETQIGLNVWTSQGMQRASLGMYVVKYGRQFFVRHTRPFELEYEPTTRPSPPPLSSPEARRSRGFADPFDRGRMGP